MPTTKAILSALIAVSGLALPTFAHPGEEHDVAHELARRDFQVAHQSRSLAKCASTLKARMVQVEAEARRAAKLKKLRQARGIDASKLRRRDFASDAALSHNETSTGYTESTDTSTIFGSNTSCILTAEVTEGPYYVTGEYIREDVRESQEGVHLHLEMQFIDVSTCEPVSADALYVDIWNCNSTGVYAGVIANGNGNDADETNLDNTFLRGIQPTDSSGVVTFDTLVPGHYSGRTNHIHIMAHQNGTIEANSTYADSTVSHVGQLFFDQTLLTAVEATSPYNTNTQSVTTNLEDTIASGEADNDYDPFVKYAYLGDDVADGLLGWISVGIDMSASYSPSAAATLTADGGVENSGSSFGGGSGSAPGGSTNGTMSGSPPSGSGMPSGGSMGPVVASGTSMTVAFNTGSASSSVASSSTVAAVSSSSVASSAAAASSSVAASSASSPVVAASSSSSSSLTLKTVSAVAVSVGVAASTSCFSSASHPHSDPRPSQTGAQPENGQGQGQGQGQGKGHGQQQQQQNGQKNGWWGW